VSVGGIRIRKKLSGAKVTAELNKYVCLLAKIK
jgi:hypothetical protein